MKDQIDNTNNDAALEQCLDYWKIRLANLPTLELPTDRPRPAVQSFNGKIQSLVLTLDLTESLKALSQREGVSLFTILVLAFQVLLHRYSGQDDIVVGSLSNDEQGCLKLEDLNILVLRTDVSGNPIFRDLLARMQKTVLEAYANQDVPFEKLLETLNLQPDRSHNPLFQVMLVLCDNAELKEPTQTGKCDLCIKLSETAQGLQGSLEYATDLFDATTIERLIGHFQTLLEGIVAHPEARLSELPLLTQGEYQQVLVEWNDTAVALPDVGFIHQLFEKQVERTPQAIAAIYQDQHLTYSELNAKANQLAHHLRNLGVDSEARVGICAERSLDMVIGLLAILKAGGACLPLDPAYPEERLAFMLEDSNPSALLMQGKFAALFADSATSLPIIDLHDESWTTLPDSNLDSNTVRLKPDSLAYIIYTSGSTGKPKGTCVLHRSLQNLIAWHIDESHLSSNDAVLIVTSCAYVFTQRAIFSALLAGARLVLANEPFDPQAIIALLAKEHVSMINITQSGLNALINVNTDGQLNRLRRITLAGEPMNPSQLLALSEPRPDIVNNYGATECAGTAIYHQAPSDLERYRNRSMPIGRPIWNTKIYILDSYQQPVPIGIAGEIYIAGTPVGLGYLNQPEMTAERFMRDPFTTQADAMMYKTGDLGRWLSDGTIEYRGRNDFQVKIRGFRVELGEIESTLRQHPQLREAVVGVYERVSGDKHIAAYVVAQGTDKPSPLELRDFLKPNLPEFMIPSAFVFLDALPINANGKLDRKALPAPDQGGQDMKVEFVAPCNTVEKQLAELWADILTIDHIGIHDNFFDLGGHSLLAVKMIVEVNKLFNSALPLGVIYQSPTIKALANILLSGEQHASYYSLVPIQTQGSRPPLFAIHTITLEDLPRYLGKDQPLYFLRYGMAGEITDRPVRLPLLSELASHYIKEMQQAQPQGPYYLMGFSFGGLVAYEMAYQLVASGHQVNLVALLDTYLTGERQLMPLHRIIHKLPIKALEIVKNKITDLISPDKSSSTDFWPHFYTPEPDKVSRSGYQPKIYSGHVTLFQGLAMDSDYFIYTLPEHAWRNLLGDKLEVQETQGSHYEIFDAQNVKTLAEKITAAIDKTINL
jgi:aspartate racemase